MSLPNESLVIEYLNDKGYFHHKEKIEQLEDRIVKFSEQYQGPACGIYFLINNNDILYVGQSNNIHSRMNEHKKSGKIEFNKFSFIPCKEDMLFELETYYIWALKPPYNKRYPNRYIRG